MLLLCIVSMPRWRNGRRARFRCECLTACRFESYPGHKKFRAALRTALFCTQDRPFLLKTERHFVYLHTQHYGLSYDKRYNRKD